MELAGVEVFSAIWRAPVDDHAVGTDYDMFGRANNDDCGCEAMLNQIEEECRECVEIGHGVPELCGA